MVDLTSLRLGWEPGVAVFAGVLRHAGGWPGARMVLFGADGELTAALDRAQVTPTVPLAADLRAASQRVQRRPERVRRHRDLPPDPTAPRAARTLIRQACIDWAIPLTTENAAALVVSELATNAVVHTGTTLGVRVDLSGETSRSASATCVLTCRYACSPAMPVSPRAQATFRTSPVCRSFPPLPGPGE